VASEAARRSGRVSLPYLLCHGKERAWSHGTPAKPWAFSCVITGREQLRLCISAAFD